MNKIMFRSKAFSKSFIILLFSILILSALTFAFSNNVKADEPIVIMTAEDLDNIRLDMDGYYMLGADIDLNVAPYNEGLGWKSIGDYWNDSFSGTLDGQGYTIKGLTIDRSTGDAYSAYATGLFGRATGSAKLYNINLENVNIIGQSNTGALVGEIGNGGLIENVTVTGTISGVGKVGGIVGWLSNAKIKESHADVTVKGGNTHNSDVGGLVGMAGGDGALIENSTSAGAVQSAGRDTGGLAGSATFVHNSSSSANVISTFTYGENSNAGGLIGSVSAYGEITNTYATGNVEGEGHNVGGLIGHLRSSVFPTAVSNSYATGTVTGKDHIGGLIGTSYGDNLTVKGSYATGNVYGENLVGGFIGDQKGKNTSIQKSYASGDITATGNEVGGFVGQLAEQTSVKDAYARGNVSGGNNVGGFIGDNKASTVQNSYATGEAAGTGTDVGGFAGIDQRGSNTANFYDQQTTGQSDTTSATPKSTQEMKTQATFKGWNFSSVWKISQSENDGYPTFRADGDGVTPPASSDFKDVGTHWAAGPIQEAVDLGLFTGYADDTFRPNNPITRAEFVVIISRAIDIDVSGETPRFTDQAQIQGWAKDAIEKAQLSGIVTGYSDGTFRPNQVVTRPEIAVMVARAFELDRNSSGSTGFADDGQIPAWAKDAVAALKDHSIIQGKAGNKFDPKANTTRAESAVILLNSID